MHAAKVLGVSIVTMAVLISEEMASIRKLMSVACSYPVSVAHRWNKAMTEENSVFFWRKARSSL